MFVWNWRMIMGNKTTKEEIIRRFGYANAFSSEDLYEFYKIKENDLKEGTFRWRVHELKKEGVITTVKRGVYIIDDKKKFEPKVSRSVKITYNMIARAFPYATICIWDTSWLHNLMNHQIYTRYVIVEVDKEVVSPVFNMLKDKRENVFMNPNEKEVENYILGEDAIIVRPITKEAPLVERSGIHVAKLEKILVDLYFDKLLLVSYRGNEMKNIFTRALAEYEINYTTLYRYARNRGIKNKIREYIQETVGITAGDDERRRNDR